MKKVWLKRKGLVIVILFFLFFYVGTRFFTTRTVSNPQFEKEIETFVQAKTAGSELALFNEKDLSGWYAFGVGKWSVENGVLTVRRGHGYLATRCDEFTDFVLSLKARVSREGNSGVFFRAQPPGWNFRPWPVGYEAQIDNHDPKNPTGSLYDRVTAPMGQARDNEWFSMTVTASGPSIRIAVNDSIVVDSTDTTHTKGFIALQAHHPWCQVDFKDIRVKIPEP